MGGHSQKTGANTHKDTNIMQVRQRQSDTQTQASTQVQVKEENQYHWRCCGEVHGGGSVLREDLLRKLRRQRLQRFCVLCHAQSDEAAEIVCFFFFLFFWIFR